MAPRIGVVVLNWNGRAHLERCLASLDRVEYSNYFVVVVDNASHDGSADWVRSNYPDFHLVALDTNRRFAGGNNAGAAFAVEREAEVVVLLNNDTTVEPSWLSSLAKCFDGPVDVVGSRICYSDDPGRIWYGGGLFSLAWGWVRHRAIRKSTQDGADPAGSTDWVSGCAMAVRASLWQQLRGLDEGYYIYVEDVDFCGRARRAGASIFYTPDTTVLHEVSASVGGGHSRFKAYHKSRAALRWVWKRTRVWQRPSAIVGRVAHDAAQMVWLMLRGSPGAALAIPRAWIDALTGQVHYQVSEDPNQRLC